MIQKLTFLRIIKTLQTLFEWKFGVVDVKSRPWAIRFDPASICNLKCVSCGTPNRKFEKGQAKIMTLDSFNHLFNKISQHVYRMTFYIRGEPLMNRDIFKMIKIASQKNIHTSFTSNFTLMKETYLKELFDSGLDWLSVALDGFSQEAYSKYRVGGNVEDVKNGIRMVMDNKKSNRYKKPFFTVYSIDFEHVQPEIDAIKKFCAETNVDELRFRHDNSNWDNSYKFNISKRPMKKCFWPWVCLTVNTDGSVYSCLHALRNNYKFGNLFKENLDEIWNNEHFVETRKYIKHKIKKEHLNLPCYTCILFN